MRLVVVLLVCLGSLVGPAALPAAGAGGALGLSRDGHSWSSRLTVPLFDPTVRWVPGDSRTERFYVRNQGESRARLRVELRTQSSDPAFVQAVSLRGRAGGGAWRRIPAGGGVLAVDLLDEGAIERVELEASLGPASRNETQRRSLHLGVDVRLVDSRASGAEPDETGGGGLLADTGSRISLGVLGLAAVLVGTGIAFLRRSRKARQ